MLKKIETVLIGTSLTEASDQVVWAGKATPLNRPAPWLPSFDVHEHNGELVLHADLEQAEISLDGSDLIVQTKGRKGRLPLPFVPWSLRSVSRPGHGDLEVHVRALAVAVV